MLEAFQIDNRKDNTIGVHLDAVSLSIAGRTIIHDLYLHLDEKRIAIIGCNGSGKTTLLRLIAGLIAPTHGNIRVEGIDPFRDRRGVLSQLGILFQNPDHQIIFPTVGEELAFGLKQQGHKADDVVRMVKALLMRHGRAHWYDASVQTLSQGQRQFLCLLSILAMKPQTILLDEPFSGLDLPTAARLSRAFTQLPQRLITVTHDPAVARVAERVVWIDAGRVRADGTPEMVLPVFEAEMQEMGERDADIDLAP
ncbi:energy-coupling factor ABC transporter ATP-binding protein [Pseudochelatococcus sp. G4_1912]|uniref:energy-coupling factor ABC transporter ATP-binding protein n=1 Tax=Pseudochelatococcus sp. G4_1912 TaxID=3114288 RepID=UPI0039C74899